MPHGIGSVGYESGLERDVLLWIRPCAGLADVITQPFTVAGWICGSYRRYTPDYLVTHPEAHPHLRRLGFGPRTIIEVKPSAFAKDVEVLQKLCLARLVTGLPVVVITELDLKIPLGEETALVH
jgi:hypothetical protein